MNDTLQRKSLTRVCFSLALFTISPSHSRLFCFGFAPIILLLLLNNMVLKVIPTFFFHTTYPLQWLANSSLQLCLSSSTRLSVGYLSLSLCFCNSIEKKNGDSMIIYKCGVFTPSVQLQTEENEKQRYTDAYTISSFLFLFVVE